LTAAPLADDDDFDDEPFDPEPFDPRLALAGEPHDDEPWDDDGQVGPDDAPPDAAVAWLHRRGAGFADGGVLDRMRPGAMLAGFIEDVTEDPLGLAELGESELIGVLCGARRMASWAAAQETEAVITLAKRRAAQAAERHNEDIIEHVSDEVAAALTLTSRSAARLVDTAGVLAHLPDVRRAQTAGIIDDPRARVFADELAMLPYADARTVAASVLPQAGGMTTGQLRRALRRAVELIDPGAARRRRAQAHEDADVHHWQEASGNSCLAGRELRPADAIAARARLTAKARWLQAHGAPGTLGELRVAAYLAAINDQPLESLLPASPGGADPACPAGPVDPAHSVVPGDPPGGAAPGLTGSANLTMPLSAWLGFTDRPGEVAGYGTADADTCRDLASRLAAHPGTQWCLTLTDPDGRAVAHACARHGPPSTGPPALDLVAGWLADLRPVTLESGECSHQRESPRYRPPPSLRHLIMIRQPTCGAPGCLQPATRTDLDHTIPYDQGGRTCECNLGPVCRHSHRAKQTPGWHLDQPEPGVMVWTLPSGRTYTTRPDPYPV
jgi:hypothetical protein